MAVGVDDNMREAFAVIGDPATVGKPHFLVEFNK